MNWWGSDPRKSARVLIIEDGKLLVFHRKRHSKKTGDWIEYYSIPGGGIDHGEVAEGAAIRELQEEMGVTVELGDLVAHFKAKRFEHFVYTGRILSGTPSLQLDSEEARHMNEYNQYIVHWVEVGHLTEDNLRYYSQYLPLIRQLAAGQKPQSVLRIDAA